MARRKRKTKITKARKTQVKRVRAKRKRRVVKIAETARQHVPASYEHALIRMIMNDDASLRSATEEALVQCCLLNSITTGMAQHALSNGMRIGRTIYTSISSHRSYISLGDYVKHIAAFFEKVGYEHVTFEMLISTIRFRIYRHEHVHIGSNIHVFEAGIFSGFISAAAQQLLIFNESACANNGASYCEFVVGGQEPASIGRSAMQEAARQITEVLRQKPMQGRPSSAYLALNYAALLDQDYSRELNMLMERIGFIYRVELGVALKNSRTVERLFELLGFGNATIKSRRPLSISVSFNRLQAKAAFAEAVACFAAGLLESGNTKALLSLNTKGEYKLSMRG